MSSTIPGSDEFLWYDPVLGEYRPFRVTLEWAERSGRPHLVGVSIRSLNPEQPVTASIWRRFNLATVTQDRLQRTFRPHLPMGVSPPELVATVYRQAYQAGLNPTAMVQDRLWASSHRQAASWVQKARRLGLLPPTEPRKAKA